MPTGAGKTMATVLPWLYRRRFHAEADVRSSTPRWLVFTLPMRVLVEQTVAVVEAWLDNLGLAATSIPRWWIATTLVPPTYGSGLHCGARRR